MGYYMSEVAVVCRPQRDQELPICALNGLHPHVSVLVVTGEIQGRLKSGPNESLVVV